MRAPHNNDKKKLVDANLRALSTSCAPSLRLILLPAPCPNMKPKALIIAIRANTTPVAPLTLVPSWLTKKVSAILYTLVTSILTVVGSPSCSTSLLTGVFVILSYCICALSVFIICIPLYISVGNRIKGPPVIYFIIGRPFEKRFLHYSVKKSLLCFYIVAIMFNFRPGRLLRKDLQGFPVPEAGI